MIFLTAKDAELQFWLSIYCAICIILAPFAVKEIVDFWDSLIPVDTKIPQTAKSNSANVAKILQILFKPLATQSQNPLEGGRGALGCWLWVSRPEKYVWTVSSDILESAFGYTKTRKSPNPLNGVTTQIFILPVLTKKDSKTGFVDIDI